MHKFLLNMLNIYLVSLQPHKCSLLLVFQGITCFSIFINELGTLEDRLKIQWIKKSNDFPQMDQLAASEHVLLQASPGVQIHLNFRITKNV